MKIILKENVENLGDMGDTVIVADGYGRNFLLPKNLAIPASKTNIKLVEHEKKLIEKRKEKLISGFDDLKKKLEALSISIPVKVGEYEKMFGSITSMDIAEKLKELDFNVDRKTIMLAEPIKDLGMHSVKIKLHSEVIAELHVNVIPEV
ncbi:MAG: 50S ribosomal protein L9 [Candidatus Acididesulfobacter guangdongensis]|uniref:Large ribosomal subunit protein bL9 n=1 Tax=Acididesulfobacter guangdongensis TaxID=2597225 RepID=A0A519BHP1_ACIG2|nr:MAG: 50S ribosomal protein L9 [Candidatus Acididesulfobacter guangdongensis]